MNSRGDVDRARRRLQHPDRHATVAFDPDTLADLPAPARRFLGRALPAGVPLATVADIEASGTIKLGKTWWRFRSTQILRAGEGFVWQPVVRRGPLWVSGADTYVAGTATMAFRLFGLVPVAAGAGPDTDLSAAGRLAAEIVAWLPQATTPQAGATWAPVDGDRASVTLSTPSGPIVVTVTVDGDGRALATSMMRWSDADTPAGERPFGGPVSAEHTTAQGVRIMGDGRIGWGWETPGWADGEFFRFHIVGAEHREHAEHAPLRSRSPDPGSCCVRGEPRTPRLVVRRACAGLALGPRRMPLSGRARSPNLDGRRARRRT